jgi:hypothetical protein
MFSLASLVAFPANSHRPRQTLRNDANVVRAYRPLWRGHPGRAASPSIDLRMNEKTRRTKGDSFGPAGENLQQGYFLTDVKI